VPQLPGAGPCPPQALIDIGFTPEEARSPAVQGKGCEVCNNSGYKGRIGLYESWRWGRASPSSSCAARPRSSSGGRRSRRHDQPRGSGLQKLRDGITTSRRWCARRSCRPRPTRWRGLAQPTTEPDGGPGAFRERNKGSTMELSLHQLLKEMTEADGTDLHITVAAPPRSGSTASCVSSTIRC